VFFEEMPLLSEKDVREMAVRELYQKMSQYQLMDRINRRYTIRQGYINLYYKKKLNLSKEN